LIELSHLNNNGDDIMHGFDLEHDDDEGLGGLTDLLTYEW
jgi:hypothetical protein